MPINIPAALPARTALEEENIFIMTDERAYLQDIRPLEIAIVNLMPTKIATEIQLLRLLSNSPIQVNITLIKAESHISKNTSKDHLDRFYTTFSSVKNNKFDGMIITGAPVEQLPFEEVDYWGELQAIMDYSRDNVFSTLHICWGAQAGLFYHFGFDKQILSSKVFGVFSHSVVSKKHSLFRGFDDVFYLPQSRYTETLLTADMLQKKGLEVLATSKEAGLSVLASQQYRQVFVTGHFEYDAETLALEYLRDRAKGLATAIPCNYFLHDDPGKPIEVRWRSTASLFFNNWLNFHVYQDTPYDITLIGTK